MNALIYIIIYSFCAGITIFLGGLLAKTVESYFKKTIENYIVHWSVAFGGGILIAAVAFVLIPKGMEVLPIQYCASIFLAGAITFYCIDKYIEQKGGVLAQAMAMLMDFIPEAIALGAVFAHNYRSGILLAFFIGFQNLPEAFNAYFDLRKSNHSSKDILMILFVLSFLGVFSSMAGHYLLINKDGLTAGLMVFSAGGILYLIFQDIAPLSKIKNHWEPALGVNLGFLVGMVGEKLFG